MQDETELIDRMPLSYARSVT